AGERAYGVLGLPLIGIASLPPKPPEKCADQRLRYSGLGDRVFPRASGAAGFLVTVTASFGHRLLPGFLFAEGGDVDPLDRTRNPQPVNNSRLWGDETSGTPCWLSLTCAHTHSSQRVQ